MRQRRQSRDLALGGALIVSFVIGASALVVLDPSPSALDARAQHPAICPLHRVRMEEGWAEIGYGLRVIRPEDVLAHRNFPEANTVHHAGCVVRPEHVARVRFCSVCRTLETKSLARPPVLAVPTEESYARQLVAGLVLGLAGMGLLLSHFGRRLSPETPRESRSGTRTADLEYDREVSRDGNVGD